MKANNNKTQEATAWGELKEFADRVKELSPEGLLGIFSIGSLPGDYFRPWQSDLDVIILLAGVPPKTLEALNRQDALMSTFQEYASLGIPYPMEVMLCYETELQRNPATGILPNPDIVARLRFQGVQLYGSYPLGQLEIPTARDFQQETERYLHYWHSKSREQNFETASPRGLFNHALALMRLYMASCKGIIEYNKHKLVKTYQDSRPEVPLPGSLEAGITRHLNGDDLAVEELDLLWVELADFHHKVIQAIRSAK
ncbi:MAG: hypothetical protein WA110_02810 [Anaerolineaceae bacterium]